MVQPKPALASQVQTRVNRPLRQVIFPLFPCGTRLHPVEQTQVFHRPGMQNPPGGIIQVLPAQRQVRLLAGGLGGKQQGTGTVAFPADFLVQLQVFQKAGGHGRFAGPAQPDQGDNAAEPGLPELAQLFQLGSAADEVWCRRQRVNQTRIKWRS